MVPNRRLSYSAPRLTVFAWQSILQIVRQSECVNFTDSHASLQRSHSCKLHTVARVVELTYLHVIVKCKSLLGGHGKARCTVNGDHLYVFFVSVN